MMPVISIILPCYNAASLLPETLDSISKQTLNDFECIAIDDGSTDATRAVLDAHAAKDPRFTVISRENRGLIATLNEAIARSHGGWIARMDADDIAHPERLARQVAALEASGADVCGVGIRFFGERDGVWLPPETDAAIKAALLFNPPFAHPGVMARAALFAQHGYDSRAQHAEDYALWCAFAKAGATFVGIAEPLLDYRVHPGQITQTRRAEMAATGATIRADYARHALPADWPEADKAGFAELAAPDRALDRSDWFTFTAQLVTLAQRDPATRPAFCTVWLDALVRTHGVDWRCKKRFSLLSQQLPPPAEERGKWQRQRARVLAGDAVYGLIKKLRGRA
ncbi:glycosyltransferase family 2 protein [Jeongeupia wiesaeckerbachi]|uniref:glycosyltransferase family 2 protein n=1 Tax=Jeongeupia wiesaeckerbachi TaxID=3051218 RepID=UPI003D800645